MGVGGREGGREGEEAKKNVPASRPGVAAPLAALPSSWPPCDCGEGKAVVLLG